jgi:immune inhibitor A
VRKWTVGLLSLALVSGGGVALSSTVANAAPQRGVASGAGAEAAPVPDELPNPLEENRRTSREIGIGKVLNGKASTEKRGASTVVNVDGGAQQSIRSSTLQKQDATKKPPKYVELSREKTDKIFVILAEFGNQRDPAFPDKDTDPNTPGPKVYDGPVHNAIPSPDRAKDNSTVWQPNYDRQHYQDIYFGNKPGDESLKTYYERQSSGRYSVDGTVSDWVKVPFNEARYGRDVCGAHTCNNTWQLIRDALTAWVADQHAQGRTDDQIKADLASYDQWDRYDYDGDGDFNEPDGYVDHFQIVHAGGDQADGDEQQGEDAIWSHRWYNFQNTTTGPAFNKLGGSQIGNTGLWVGDYTIQPENGGVSVFAHEYGHDLGLPDHYDTTGAGGNAENPVNWWTIMAQSRVGAAGDQGIGTRPADFGAWDKLQLGWLDYEVVKAAPGLDKTLQLGPHEYNTRNAQGVVVVLPKKKVVQNLVKPAAGTKDYWSGNGDKLNNTLTRSVAIPAGQPATLTFQADWDIEDCGQDACDYAYVEVDSGAGFTAIPGTIANAAEGNGIDGKSGGWKPAAFDLSAYAGKTVNLRFRYTTDANTGGIGFFADNIKVTSGTATVFTDGAESGAAGWAATGFTAVGETATKEYDNYYVASNRTYESFDQYLKTGPYNFGFLNSRPDWVEHFPYQTGLLISYWDTSYPDNNTSVHPGGGEVLPIDAHPEITYRLDGQPWRPRFQGYDDPFGTTRADSLTLHYNGAASYIRGQSGNATFDDSKSYYSEDLSAGMRYGVKVPNNGVKIKVLQQKGINMKIQITN